MTEFIRLLDTTGTNVLDSVSTSYEDSFGLETFGELIQEHMNADSQGNKSFIIARVQTWDHKQPDRAFYSYYNAYHLNKILFQTQIYLGKKLIHRLHVLNPLTNSDIIGNVLYFKVVYRAPKNVKGETPVVPAIDKTAIIGSSIAEEETGDSWTLSSPAVAEATEEEGNLNAKMPFPNRKISIIPHGVSPLPNFSFPLAKRRITQIPVDPESDSISRSPPNVPVVQVTEDESEPKGGRRRTVSYEARSKPAAGTITLHQRTRTNVPAGTVTQFSVPVPKSRLADMAPSTPKGRRRTLSYANAVAAGGRRGTMREWANMIHEEQEKEDTRGPLSAPVGGGFDKDFDTVPVFGSAPNEGETRTEAFIPYSTGKPAGSANSDVKNTSKETSKVQVLKSQNVTDDDDAGALHFNSYDAIMVGTDNDFLESAKTRSLFKANAIKPEDVVLFEMPEFTGVQRENTRPTTLIVQEQFLCNFCYPTPEQLARSSPGARLFHGCKCYFAAVLLLIAIFVLIFLTLSPVQEKKIH